MPTELSSHPHHGLVLAALALARDERARRIANGEDNHIDEEDWLLVHWAHLLADGEQGAVDVVLREALAYATSQRVAFRPSNPAYASETAPNADRADRLAEQLRATSAGVIHDQATAFLRERSPSTEPIMQVFCPCHLSYTAYQWKQFGDGAICYQFSIGERFADYALVTMDDYLRLESRIPINRRIKARSQSPRGGEAASR